ncbi:MAG: reverse transcriptase N-terminal domain-containing protein, partial [Clostridiales bacterium]|nr:reverse transcriptase N-terminal domain-containing protein [Clostridiales bacterium]
GKREEPKPQKPARQKTIYTYEDIIEIEKKGGQYDFIQHSDMTDLWDAIDWDAAEAHLMEMQASIAKAANMRDWDLIARRQKKLTGSIDARVLAVRRVCSTAACCGVDNIKWEGSHEKMAAALSLGPKGYRARPARMLIINCKNGKERRMHMDTYFDRAMQTLYAYALDPVAESWGDRKSFAYRKGRSAFDLHAYIMSMFSGKNAPKWALIADVKGCYEHISHDWIQKNIPLPSNVLREFLDAGYVFSGELFPTKIGVGIGCTISPIIANMTLDGMQAYIFQRLHPGADIDSIDYAEGNLVRYADDIIVSARSEESALLIRGYISDFLDERGLELSQEKTKIVNVDDGFTFMSRQYEKKNDHFSARPSDEAVERFMASMRKLIENYTGSQESLIKRINKKIDGWATYHKMSEADEQFRKMDVYISALLLELCEKKHPNWDREKVLEKYWYVDAKGRHHYALPDKKEVRVKTLADTLFVDYIPVRTNVNPYLDIGYLDWKTRARQISGATGIYRSIWNRQEGKCYYCGKSMLRDEDIVLADLASEDGRSLDRKAYVHARCMDGSIEYVDAEEPPASLDDVMELLGRLEEGRKDESRQFYLLSEFFRTCNKNSVTLTFPQIEDIMDAPLSEAAETPEFWYRTGFETISQCWLDNGYEIRRLHLDGTQRVVFCLTPKNKNTSSVDLPAVIRFNRIPVEAKYELENYFRYIIKKYGLN